MLYTRNRQASISSRRVGPLPRRTAYLISALIEEYAHAATEVAADTHSHNHTHKTEHRWPLIFVQAGDVMDCFTRSLSLLILLSLSLNEGLSSKTSFWTPPPGPGIGGEAMAMAGGTETPYAPLDLCSKAGVHHLATHVDGMGGSDRQVSPCVSARHTITRRRLKRL